MTLIDAINDYKDRFPSNSLTEDRLTSFISALDNMIQIDMLNTYPYVYSTDNEGNVSHIDGTLVTYDYAADKDIALKLSGTPFEDIYGLYLASMAFHQQQDWIKYSNEKSMFNARYLDAVCYYSRTNSPVRVTKIKNIW